MIELRRKEGESVSSFLYRFSRKIQQSGVLKESKKRKHRKRNPNKRAVHESALYRFDKKQEITKLKKLGKL